MITATRYRATAEINRQTRLSDAIARAQVDISTGKRIQTASDDPISAARIADIRRSQADQTAWGRNVDTARSLASQVDTSLSNMQDIFNRVKELTLAGASESASHSDRQAMVAELQSLRVALSNLETGTTPTGQDLFPTDSPLQIAVSATERLPATAKRSDIFDTVGLSSGTGTLDSVIAAAADALAIDDTAARSTAANTSLSDIDEAAYHVSDARSAQGVRALRLDDAADAITQNGSTLTEERSLLEDTDVAATMMQLNAKTLSLQAAQQAFAKVNRNTLFDLLS